EAGGNAVDACVAAAFVSWVAESPLTGPGGGGFMLVHSGADCRSRLYDFFVAVPGSGARGAAAPMEEIDVVFEADSSQVFRIGAAGRGRSAGLGGSGRHAGAVRQARREGALHRRDRKGAGRAREGERGTDHAARSLRISGGPPPPGHSGVPGPRVPLESTAVV